MDMPRRITIGEQSFLTLRERNYFYVDKTKFIRDWWLGGDPVTLITRPRRFGKTLMLDAVKTFFAPECAGRSDLFEGLEVWNDEQIRLLQGKIPVIFLSFARFTNNTYSSIISRIKTALVSTYGSFSTYIDMQAIPDPEKEIFMSVNSSMTDETAQDSLHYLCKFIAVQYGIKPIILLDEYDTPLQQAWLHGFWDEMTNFMRGFFNATFKDNPWIGRGLITGITRVAKESIFSDMNNLNVVGITSELYSDCFGFTEEEVFLAMDEYGLKEKNKVKEWYDGFIFGKQKEIYNPWSIVNYLSEKKFSTYWANTSSNAFVGELIANGDEIVKEETERLLHGKSIITKLDEQIIFHELYTKEGAIWSLLMAAGYVKPLSFNYETGMYEIILTNLESKKILEKRISEWFGEARISKNNFVKALLYNNLEEMNDWINDITKKVFSFFDTTPSGSKEERPENFYHAFILGLIVDLKQYEIRSNSESGYGRYDVMLIPKNRLDHGIVIEFKTYRPKKEADLTVTCNNALKQIYEKEYIVQLKSKGVSVNNIYVYGFAFKGKYVQILGGKYTEIDWERILNKNASLS